MQSAPSPETRLRTRGEYTVDRDILQDTTVTDPGRLRLAETTSPDRDRHHAQTRMGSPLDPPEPCLYPCPSSFPPPRSDLPLIPTEDCSHFSVIFCAATRLPTNRVMGSSEEICSVTVQLRRQALQEGRRSSHWGCPISSECLRGIQSDELYNGRSRGCLTGETQGTLTLLWYFPLFGSSFGVRRFPIFVWRRYGIRIRITRGNDDVGATKASWIEGIPRL